MINKLCLMYVTFRKNKNYLMKNRQNKCSIIQVNSNQEHSNSFEGDCFLKKIKIPVLLVDYLVTQ